MLMFTFHIAFALGLMALTFGIILKKKCCHCCAKACDTTNATVGQNGNCKSKCKCTCWIGCIIAILALLSLICTGHAGFQHWKNGDFKVPMAMESTSETINMKVQ